MIIEQFFSDSKCMAVTVWVIDGSCGAELDFSNGAHTRLLHLGILSEFCVHQAVLLSNVHGMHSPTNFCGTVV